MSWFLNKQIKQTNTISFKPNYNSYQCNPNRKSSRQLQSKQRQHSLDYINYHQYINGNSHSQSPNKNTIYTNFPTERQYKNVIKLTNSFKGNPNKTISHFNNSHQVQYVDIQVGDLQEIIDKYGEINGGSNQTMKQIVKEQIFSWLSENNPIMKRLNKHLLESVLLLGTLHIYSADEIITNMEQKLCFVLYGRVKIYNKDFKLILDNGDVFGEQVLFGCQIMLKAKVLDRACVFMMPMANYRIMREQSIKNGLRNQFNELQVGLRRNFIKKKLRESSRHRMI